MIEKRLTLENVKGAASANLQKQNPIYKFVTENEQNRSQSPQQREGTPKGKFTPRISTLPTTNCAAS